MWFAPDADPRPARRLALGTMCFETALEPIWKQIGWTTSQVDLRISNAVDLPNVTVSAFLPEDIFQS